MPRKNADEFSEPTKKIIAQRAGYKCAYPGCLAPTLGPASASNKVINIGEAAHITAASVNGPRYDSSLTSEARMSSENGIWMCRTHAALIDRDVEKYTVDLLTDWKFEAEDLASRMMGKSQGCSEGELASVSPAVRIGAETNVVVESQSLPYVNIFDPSEFDPSCEQRMTWFVQAFVIQFSVQKSFHLKNVVVDHLLVTVHEAKPIPAYKTMYGAYPAEVSLFYVEIDSNSGNSPREFRPTQFYTHGEDGEPEMAGYPSPIVLDNEVPTQIALRFNAKKPAMYLVSADVVVSAGKKSERLSVMPPQWAIFEEPQPYDDDF